MKTIIRVYLRKGWRWQMRDARNGKIIGASTEAYVRQSACLQNLERVTGLRLHATRDPRASDIRLTLFARDWEIP